MQSRNLKTKIRRLEKEWKTIRGGRFEYGSKKWVIVYHKNWRQYPEPDLSKIPDWPERRYEYCFFTIMLTSMQDSLGKKSLGDEFASWAEAWIAYVKAQEPTAEDLKSIQSHKETICSFCVWDCVENPYPFFQTPLNFPCSCPDRVEKEEVFEEMGLKWEKKDGTFEEEMDCLKRYMDAKETTIKKYLKTHNPPREQKEKEHS